MRRFLALGLFLLAAAASGRAQGGYTTVSATVKDSNNTLYAGGHGSASFVPSPGATQVPLISGSTFQTVVPIPQIDSFGNFSIVLVDNNAVTDGHSSPPASQWAFNICSANTPPVCFTATMTITGATQNITATLQAAAAIIPLIGGTGTVTTVSTSLPITGGPFSVSGTIGCPTCVATGQTNVFGAFLQNFAASTIEIPQSPGFVTSALSTIGLDTTAKLTHLWSNSADSIAAVTTSTSTTTTQPLFATAVAGVYNPRAIATGDLPSITDALLANPYSGVGTPTACSNQFVTGFTLARNAAPTSTCTTATLASAQFANQGTTTTVLHGNAAGNPSFGAVVLSTDVSGQLPIGNVGTSGLSGTSPVTISAGGAIGCATCVVASSPGVGLAHFAGSTQTVTSSLVVQGDVTNGYVDLSSAQTVGGSKAFTGTMTNTNSNDILWVGPGAASYNTIAAALAAAGSNQTIIAIRSTYAGGDCAASVVANLTFWDFRSGNLNCPQNFVNWNQQSASGAHSLMRSVQTRVSPTFGGTGIYSQSIYSGTLPTGQTYGGLAGEAISGNGAAVTVAASTALVGIEGDLTLNSPSSGTQTWPSVYGIIGLTQSVSGNTVNATNVISVKGSTYLKGGTETITNAISVFADIQTAGTTQNYSVYSAGTSFFTNASGSNTKNLTISGQANSHGQDLNIIDTDTNGHNWSIGEEAAVGRLSFRDLNVAGGATFDFTIPVGGTGFSGILSQSNTANRTYTFPDSSGTIALNFNAVAGAGQITPTIVWSTTSAATTASISATTMFTNIASTQVYKFDYAVDQTVAGTSCTGNSTVLVNLIYTDPNTSTAATLPIGQFTIVANGTIGNQLNGTPVMLISKASTVIQYSTTFTAGTACSPAPTYQVYPRLIAE